MSTTNDPPLPTAYLLKAILPPSALPPIQNLLVPPNFTSSTYSFNRNEPLTPYPYTVKSTQIIGRSHPPIERVIHVPAKFTFEELGRVLVIAFNWREQVKVARREAGVREEVGGEFFEEEVVDDDDDDDGEGEKMKLDDYGDEGKGKGKELSTKPPPKLIPISNDITLRDHFDHLYPTPTNTPRVLTFTPLPSSPSYPTPPTLSLTPIGPSLYKPPHLPVLIFGSGNSTHYFRPNLPSDIMDPKGMRRTRREPKRVSRNPWIDDEDGEENRKKREKRKRIIAAEREGRKFDEDDSEPEPEPPADEPNFDHLPTPSPAAINAYTLDLAKSQTPKEIMESRFRSSTPGVAERMMDIIPAGAGKEMGWMGTGARSREIFGRWYADLVGVNEGLVTEFGNRK